MFGGAGRMAFQAAGRRLFMTGQGQSAWKHGAGKNGKIAFAAGAGTLTAFGVWFTVGRPGSLRADALGTSGGGIGNNGNNGNGKGKGNGNDGDDGDAALAKASSRPVAVTLYQYEVCPFCCKVKAFLDANGVPYNTVEVNPLTKAEIKWSKGYRKVPIAYVNGELSLGSGEIIKDVIRTAEIPLRYGTAGPGKLPDDDSDEMKRFRWVDDVLVHTLPPNIYRTPREALQAFEYIESHSVSANWSAPARIGALYFGAAAMWAISKRLKKRHGISNERESLYNAIGEWIGEVGDKEFHGGSSPDLADLAVFGVLRSVEGLDTFGDAMENTSLGGWYGRMRTAVGPSSRVEVVTEPSPDFRAEIRRIKS